MEKMSSGKQQEIWDEEHKNPKVLLQMEAKDVSGGVEKFFNFLKSTGEKNMQGVEMGCGKGRNAIWLAEQGEIQKMDAFDFSPAAIAEAKKRALEAGTDNKVEFKVQDATTPWPYADKSLDFAIDCFATTDIDSVQGRDFAATEFKRVLKDKGYLLVYTLSTDDEFHKEMILKSPAEERNAFYHSTGKFEKTFDEKELRELYKDFNAIKFERVHKTAKFSGRDYPCHHFWVVFQKRD